VTTNADRTAERVRRGRKAARAAGQAEQRAARRAEGRRRDAEEEGEAREPRTGAKRTVMGIIQEIPLYLRLLGGLLTDRRVARLDKILVGAAIAYILLPADFLPDFIPFLGEVDDVFLLVTALQRLISNAGRSVVLSHWGGDPKALAALNLRQVITAATFFLPGRLRRRLKAIGR
jgi:uncharacterized membrane protein YkvA (DUF1232 family)